MLQYITQDQIELIKEVGVAASTIGALWRVVVAARNKLHEIMTDNANRVRDDLVAHIDRKFVEHESSAFARLDDQDRRLKDLETKISEIVNVLKNQA